MEPVFSLPLHSCLFSSHLTLVHPSFHLVCKACVMHRGHPCNQVIFPYQIHLTVTAVTSAFSPIVALCISFPRKKQPCKSDKDSHGMLSLKRFQLTTVFRMSRKIHNTFSYLSSLRVGIDLSYQDPHYSIVPTS